MLRKQLPKQLEQRDQKQLEPDHFVSGSQGAEFCRKIDVTSVEEAVLSLRLEAVGSSFARKSAPAP
jgi:hypothetical protein